MMNLICTTTTRRALLTTACALSLVGCASTSGPSNLADTVARQPALSTFNGLIAQAGLSETLKNEGPFTVFAPTNDAFKAVPASTMSDLAKNPEKLKAVLTFHIVAGKTMAADVKNSQVKTLNGATVALSKAGDFVTIESAAVVSADAVALNGVAHSIDTVLLPPKK